MLRKILSPRTCADCRNCCVFQEESRWETPVVPEDDAAAVRTALSDDGCLVPHGKSSALAAVRREPPLPAGAEPYRCAALDERRGCRLPPEQKPFDCRLWPLRVMRKDDGIFITISGDCRAVSGAFIEKAEALLREGLEARITAEILKNQDIVKPFSGKYRPLREITGLLPAGLTFSGGRLKDGRTAPAPSRCSGGAGNSRADARRADSAGNDADSAAGKNCGGSAGGGGAGNSCAVSGSAVSGDGAGNNCADARRADSTGNDADSAAGKNCADSAGGDPAAAPENAAGIFRSGDYGAVKALLAGRDSRCCEDCALGLFVWKERYALELLEIGGARVIRSKADGSFLFPVPEAAATEAVRALLGRDGALRLCRLTENQKSRLESDFPGVFSFEEDEGSFDYLYEAESLAELKGRKLSKKRNHINAFLAENGDWTAEPLTDANRAECAEFAEAWYAARAVRTADAENQGEAAGAETLEYERNALLKVLAAFESLEADGLILRVGGKCAAFTVGQRISAGTYDVVFEKADERIRGAYTMINREFVRYLRKKYPGLRYVNRENDLNLAGLRKAKRSYMPCEIIKKYTAESKNP